MSNKSMYYSATGTGYVSTPSFAIPNTGILTVEAWMKSSFNATISQAIMGDNADSNTIGYILINRGLKTNTLYYYYANGAGQIQGILGNFFQNLDGQYIHIVTVCDYPNNKLYVYRNGVLFDTKTLTGTPVFPSTDRVKYIGSTSPGGRNITDGSLDEVRIYNRGLGAEEVLEHYNGIFKDESNLQLYYNFNEDSGTTVLDQSGNGRNGTMNGSTSREEFPPQFRSSITSVNGVESITF